MEAYKGFCSCRDTKCPFHPANHSQGCTPCIRKNLKEREIPSCFFNLVGSAAELSSFHFEDFAEYVQRHREEAESADEDAAIP